MESREMRIYILERSPFKTSAGRPEMLFLEGNKKLELELERRITMHSQCKFAWFSRTFAIFTTCSTPRIQIDLYLRCFRAVFTVAS